MVRLTTAAIAAMIFCSATASAEQPQWQTTQTIDAMGGKATAIPLPPGKVIITITMQEQGVRPSTNCLVLDLGKRAMGGEIAQKGNVCTISFIAHDPMQPVVLVVSNQDYITHDYLIRAFYINNHK
jgi:hypothetical protein